MKKIAVITATRAEFGLLAPVIRQLRKNESDDLKIELIVTGTHLSEHFGMTINEILDSGIRIDHRIEVPVESQTPIDISRNQSEVLVKVTTLFEKENYSAVIILGDRYEMLAVAISAGNTRTPIFHLCGGDTTEGAIDEWIRHSITKMSYLHFVTNEDSRKRVIQLGENPDRVFNYGSTSLDNIMTLAYMEKAEVLTSIGLPDCNYALCTYHPVTMDGEDVEYKVNEFLKAIKSFTKIQFIVTKSNADQGGNKINLMLEEAESEIENLHVYSSLGVRKYLSLMKAAMFVLGNSSSGIIEAPALHVPTVNIGDRQRGRLQAESILNCAEDFDSICASIKRAMSLKYRQICDAVVSPYGDGYAANKIAQKCIEVVLKSQIDLKKEFYNLY